jgi:hypothetical protein
MSDNYDDTADWLTSVDTIKHTISREDADDLQIEVEDITEDELEAIEERAQEGPDAEAEVYRESIEEYLVKPDVDTGNIPMNRRNVLFFHMQLAWSGIDEVSAAMDEMEIPGQGNR